ncbi:hypothetical protein [Methylobacterium goesingense]|uniref:Uncharacterized protein n=1 Tax=Methylobacterium goesingense TaxID=243690 RepID=A0ABV2L9T1_9HYPH|nr:hypothetical protein [Methylobacterium goesingense]GJD74103.1 hypothetical protein CFIICLFH_2336 [Methylobacterium goesingense]
MTALTHLDATPHQTTNAMLRTDASPVGPDGATMNRAHRIGDTIDTVDQVSSVTLLGMALVGAGVMLVAHWIVG